MSICKPDFETALGLFNRARFFDAHEVFEDLWRGLPKSSPARKHLQGLVQVAVAFHHESRGNLSGAKSVLDRALRNLAGAEVSFPNIEVEQLRNDMLAWQVYLADRQQRPRALPRITLRNRS